MKLDEGEWKGEFVDISDKDEIPNKCQIRAVIIEPPSRKPVSMPVAELSQVPPHNSDLIRSTTAVSDNIQYMHHEATFDFF